MIKKALAILLLTATVGLAQTPWHYVKTDGSNLVSMAGGVTNIIAESITNVVAPAYGYIRIINTGYSYGSTNIVYNGTGVGGYTNTFETDGIYDATQATGVFTNRYFFEDSDTFPIKVSVVGYFFGNPSVYISVQASNVVTHAWTEIGQMQDSDEDAGYYFLIPEPQTNYIINSTSAVQFCYVGGANAARYLYLDEVRLKYAGLTTTNAGTYYPLAGGVIKGSENMTVTNYPITFTTQTNGEYKVTTGGPGTESNNTTFYVYYFTNDVITDIGFQQHVGALGASESSWMEGYLVLTNGAVVQPRLASDRSGGFVTPINLFMSIERVGK